MEKFLFFKVIVSSLNIIIIVYAYSLNFFQKKWRKKDNQDTLGAQGERIIDIFHIRLVSRSPLQNNQSFLLSRRSNRNEL